VAGVRVGLSNREAFRGTGAVSAANGSLSFAGVLHAGRHAVSVGPDHVLVEPDSFVIDAGEHRDLVVVVKAEDEVDTIEGTAVDEAGLPAAGLFLCCEPPMSGPITGATTRQDGGFRILRKPNRSTEPVTLAIWFQDNADYEPYRSASAVAWGTRDLRIVVRRRLSIELLVVDRESGMPIDAYRVRCIPDPETSDWNPHQESIAGPVSKGGRVLRNVRRGSNLLFIRPDHHPVHFPAIHRFEVGDQGAPLQRVVLERGIEGRVRVERTDGTPVAGSHVHVCLAAGNRETSRPPVLFPFEGLYSTTNGPSLGSVFHARTDQSGEAVLMGPARTKVVVRAKGPGHIPTDVNDVEFRRGGPPLRIVVKAGAIVRGRVQPPEALSELAAAAFLGRREPTIFFDSHPSGMHHSSVALQADGTFQSELLSAGDWRVSLQVWLAIPGGGAHGAQHPVALVSGLQDGETRELTVDLSHLRPGKVEGQIFENGLPVAGCRYALQKAQTPAAVANHALSHHGVTDGEGRFTAHVIPGTYVCWLLPEQGAFTHLDSTETVTVIGGQTAAVTFQLHSVRLRVRLIGGDGKALEGRSLVAAGIQPNGGEWEMTRSSDADGWVEFAHAPRSTLRLLVWPAELSSEAARIAFTQERKDGGRELRSRRIELEPVQLDAQRAEVSVERRVQ
jgi:hypothetical protein